MAHGLSLSLRRQLASWLLIPLLVVWVIGAVKSYYIAVDYANLANDRELFDSALTLASQVRSDHGTIAVNQAQTALQMITIDPYDKVFFKVSAPELGVIAGREVPAPPMDEPVPDKPLYYDGVVDGMPVRIASLFHLVRNNGKEVQVRVQVAETLKKRQTLAREILAGIALPQFVLVLMVLAIGWFGIRRGLSSLDRIQREVRNRSHLDLRPVREENAPREIGVLVHALNDLLGQVNSVLSAQNRFIANAAHQMRTPLAGIKTQVDFALRQSDPELIRHALMQLQSSNDRTIHLVNQLLVLARAEPGSEPAKTQVDLLALARGVTGEWVPAALKKGIDLGFEARSGTDLIQGNVLLLREMLGNLLDNAIRYAPVEGVVTVNVSSSGDWLVLSVQDSGPGIPEGERVLLFERFYRTANAQDEGCGLGLAIVREIARLHGGEATLEDSIRGALFQVKLPKFQLHHP